MSQFSSNEAVSLEKEIDSVINSVTEPGKIDEVYEITRCLEWIKSNQFHKVCLQFPDHLLPDSSEVALRLQQELGENVYILADTAYESCCIDYVSAAHVNADGVIHFGPLCFSITSANIPYLNIYEKSVFDIDEFSTNFEEASLGVVENVVILLDTPFIHLKEQVSMRIPGVLVELIDNPSLCLRDSTVIFIGDSRNRHRKLPNLKFSHKTSTVYYYVERSPALIKYDQDDKVLRRRYFLIEKIKDSNTIGIVIGTLGIKNYLQVIERLKKLITMHKKKYYMISVGKPTVAKLANFPEIDIYAVVSCSLNEIYDSREFYKPIVTVYDVEMALNPLAEGLSFNYGFDDIIDRPMVDSVEDSSDVSLLTGGLRGVSNVELGGELVKKEEGIIALNSTYGAGFLSGRSWKGLEKDLGNSEAKIAEEGRHGIAQEYSDEVRLK